MHSPLLPARPNYKWAGLFHISDWLPTTLEIAGLDPITVAPDLDGMSVWQALVTGLNSPRTELLHEIDRIAEPRFACSGPIAPTDGNTTWSLPPVFDRFIRAAIHVVVDGAHYKLVVGECAGEQKI